MIADLAAQRQIFSHRMLSLASHHITFSLANEMGSNGVR